MTACTGIRGFVLEQAAKVPRSFRMRARNPERSVTVGEGGTPLWMNVGGPPFASDLDEGRRSGRIQDHDRFVKLTQATDVLNCVQTGACEATDLQMESRHMDQEYSTIRWSDKPYTTYGTSGPRARDGIRMAEIVHGGREAIEAEPALLGIVNPNSPLIWDFRMTDALMAWAEAKQPIVVTPFLLAGATSAVSVSGGLTQQVAEALSGVALAQVVREGAPCLYGSFFTVTDMRTGSPAFGTPESVFGVLAGSQMARRYGLPYRGGWRARLVAGRRRAGRGRNADDAVGDDAGRDRRRAACGRLARGRALRRVSRSSRSTWSCSNSSRGRWPGSDSRRRSSRSTR